MSRLLAAAAGTLLALSSAAADAKPKSLPTRAAGKVVKSSYKIAPSPEGPVFREGRLTMADKAGREENLKAGPRTKVTLDGKPSKFSAAAPGTIVLRALYDPNTKELSALDLKSVPRPEAPVEEAPGAVTGEVANTDVLKGALSIRTGPQSVREYEVTDQTLIIGKNGAALAFEALKIGDAVEVNSRDGKSAAEVRVLLAP